MSDPVEEFGKHLDSCEQCQNNPFELCVAGHELLMLSVGVVAESQPTKRALDGWWAVALNGQVITTTRK